MPSSIDIDVVMWLVGGAWAITCSVIVLLFNNNTNRILEKIDTQGERIDRVEEAADKSLDLHGKHLVKFHARH